MARSACGPYGYNFRNNASIQFRRRPFVRGRRRLGLGLGLIAAGVLLLLLCVPDIVLVFGVSATLIVIGKCLI